MLTCVLVTRWIAWIRLFDFDVRHVPGTKHGAADGLSRRPATATDDDRSSEDIDDFIDGLLKVIEQGEHLGIYNIGTQEEITVEMVAQEVGRYFGREVCVIPGKLAEGSTPRRCPDITKLRRLGFMPHYTFREGLALAAQWYTANAHLQPEH